VGFEVRQWQEEQSPTSGTVFVSTAARLTTLTHSNEWRVTGVAPDTVSAETNLRLAMSEYYKIHNNDREVIARIDGKVLAHAVAEAADELRAADGPHSVQEP
jgi:hypothetical protein